MTGRQIRGSQCLRMAGAGREKSPRSKTLSRKGSAHGRRHRHRSPAGAAQADHHAQQGDLDGELPPAAARDLDAALLRGDARSRPDDGSASRRRCRRWRRRSSRARSWSSPRSCAPATACSKACSTSCPSARVSHIGVYRDHETLKPVEYYFKAPEDLAEPPGDRRRSDAGDRQFLDRGDRQAEGARREEHPLPLPAGGARGHRAISAARIPTCRSSPPRSTAISTRRATSCRVSAMPATGCTARSSGQPPHQPSRQLCQRDRRCRRRR